MPQQNNETDKNHPSKDKDKSTPPAGPHAKDHLINSEKTPGAGTLPSSNKKGDVDPGAG
jgi:hypothetical protein